MLFRSDSGLTNRALFTGTDYTLYVEGGGGVAGAGSSDVIFWGDTVRALRPELRVTVVAYGGKPELETMAEKVRKQEIKNTIVALDSDFDEILDERKDHPNILYTYGYSWENDAFCGERLGATLCRLLKVENVSVAQLDSIKEGIDDILRRLIPWVNADFWLRTMNSSLFPKISPGRFLSNAPGTFEVSLNVKELWKLFKVQMKSVSVEHRKSRPAVWLTSASCFLHGHTIQALMKCVLSYAVRLLGKKVTITDDLMEHVMISAFCQHITRSNDHRSAHYKYYLSRVA